MGMVKKCFFSMLVSFFLLNPAFTQAFENTRIPTDQQRHQTHLSTDQDIFWALSHHINTTIWDMHQPNDVSQRTVNHIFSRACLKTPHIFGKAEGLREDARASGTDLGISLNGGVRNGLQQSGLSSINNNSAFIGLNWDVLSNGWQGNKGKEDLYQLKADREDLREKMAYEDRLNQCRVESVTNVFIASKSQVLSMQYEWFNFLLPLKRQAYLRGAANLEDVLAVDQALQATANDLLRLRPHINHENNELHAPVRMLPALDVSMSAVMAAIDKSHDLDTWKQLDDDILSQTKDNAQQARLRFFLRYESNGQSFKNWGPTGGVRFSVPLFEDTKAGLPAYRRANAVRQGIGLAQRKRDANQAYDAFLASRSRMYTQWYRYLSNLEGFRRSLLQAQLVPERVDINVVSKRMKDLLDAALELQRVNEQVYQRVALIFSAAHVLFQDQFIQILPMHEQGYRGRSGTRAVYMWSKTFQGHSNALLYAFLRTKQINTVMLSAGHMSKGQKFDDFIVQARRKHVRVAAMFSNQSWLKKDHYAGAVKKILTVIHAEDKRKVMVVKHVEPSFQMLGGEGIHLITEIQTPQARYLDDAIGAIHLDVEPQAVQSYKGNHQAQAQALLELLQYLRLHLPKSLHISISVPVYWDVQAYRELAQLADQLYVMSYGSSKASTIIRRLHAIEQAVPLNRITLALRTPDFDSEFSLEHMIDTLQQETGIKHFAIHAMGSYLNLSDQVLAHTNTVQAKKYSGLLP